MPGRRVVFLEAYPHVRGGAQVVTSLLAVGLRERGWHTEVVAPMDGPALDCHRTAGVPVTILPVRAALERYGGEFGLRDMAKAGVALLPWWRKLAGFLRSRRPVVLDVVDQRGAVMGGPGARAARVPWVWHVHCPGPSAAIDRFGPRFSARSIVPSHGAAARLGGEGHSVVPMALGRIPDPVRSRTSDDRPRVVSVGRLHPVKGFDVLVAATAELVTSIEGLVVEIVGAPQEGHESHARALAEQARRLGVDDVVHFVGYVADPWAQFGGAAIYVQPSRYEAFGIALVEAMAAGLPVVATAVDGPLEILADRRHGLLVPPDDPAALAAAMRQVLCDPALAADLAERGRQHALANFTPDLMVGRTAPVFEAALRR